MNRIQAYWEAISNKYKSDPKTQQGVVATYGCDQIESFIAISKNVTIIKFLTMLPLKQLNLLGFAYKVTAERRTLCQQSIILLLHIVAAAASAATAVYEYDSYADGGEGANFTSIDGMVLSIYLFW